MAAPFILQAGLKGLLRLELCSGGASRTRTAPPTKNTRYSVGRFLNIWSIFVLLAVEAHIRTSKLESKLLHLVKMRASQINGCAFCLDMHSTDARADGESEQRLYTLNAWQETPYYSDRERAALEWTEAVTTLGNGHASDGVYERFRAHFSEDEMVALTLSIAMINSWNRMQFDMCRYLVRFHLGVCDSKSWMPEARLRNAEGHQGFALTPGSCEFPREAILPLKTINDCDAAHDHAAW
jgi:AhpD family alkylhydroperoxidase